MRYRQGRKGWDAREVRALRRHLGLSQQEMARRLGTRQQTISEWERGLYQPRGTSHTLLSLIAEGTGYDYTVQREGGGGQDEGQARDESRPKPDPQERIP